MESYVHTDHNLHICNPFMVRESLTMALEVAACHMSDEQDHLIQRLLMTLKHGTEFDVMELAIDDETEEAVKACLHVFKQTATWQWLKGDFRDAILKLERHILSRNPCGGPVS